MDSPPSLDMLVQYLNRKYSPAEQRSAFWQECKKNLGLEAVCIAACEAGEFGSEVFAYQQGWPDINTPGLLGGITVGLLYSFTHTYLHGRRHSKTASLGDAVQYALSTESACVVSATGVEYGLGLATVQNPFSGINLLIRGLGLAPAFALGLAAMSALTYLQNQEAGRFLAMSRALPLVHNHLVSHPKALGVSLSDRRLQLQGAHASLTISERAAPRSLRDCDSTCESLYRIKSSACRYDPASSIVIRDTVGKLFHDAGLVITPVQDVFRH